MGLIPGPGESEPTFCERVRACLELKALLAKPACELLPFKNDTPATASALESASQLLASLYGINPTWIPLFYSNYRLAPWHGGAAWIFQLQNEGPRMSFLQLRKAFASQNSYLHLYSRDELIAHECAHVGRMAFNEERFEELVAYRSSSSRLRAWLGPIVDSACESMIFIALLFLLMLLDLYLLSSGYYDTYLWCMRLKLIPLGLLLFAMSRLWLRQRTFGRCLKQLSAIAASPQKANHLIYRLSDHEITLFAASSAEDICTYASAHAGCSLRWRLLSLAYFPSNFA
jgi:hypothetical protein